MCLYCCPFGYRVGVVHNGGGENKSLCASGNIMGAYGSRMHKVGSLYV
jgi:hypothetical protein